MRELIDNQFEGQETPSFGCELIKNIIFDIRSRDEVTKTLRGLPSINF